MIKKRIGILRTSINLDRKINLPLQFLYLLLVPQHMYPQKIKTLPGIHWPGNGVWIEQGFQVKSFQFSRQIRQHGVLRLQHGQPKVQSTTSLWRGNWRHNFFGLPGTRNDFISG